jgi:hypothetical protein
MGAFPFAMRHELGSKASLSRAETSCYLSVELRKIP